MDNYERILETANLRLQCEQAIPELTVRCKDADPAVRFWGVLGLAAITQTAGREAVAGILPSLRTALQDGSVSVRLTAAEGLCNLGHYQEATPVLSKALTHPSPSAQIRSACILDTQPPEASAARQPAIEYLRKAVAKIIVRDLPGIPYGLNDPFGRAFRAITGQENYYRWWMGASGSPKSPLMTVQEREFVPAEETALIHTRMGEPSTLERIGGKISAVSSFSPGHEAKHMLDGDTATFWHSRFQADFAPPPHYVVLEVPAGTVVAGLAYTPRSKPNGRVLAYEVSVSDDGETWAIPMATGRIQANATEQETIRFAAPTGKRFIKLEVTDAVSAGGQPIAAIGEPDVLLR